MSKELVDRVLAELREVRFRAREVGGIFVTPKAMEVLRRTQTNLAELAVRYEDDRPGAEAAELIGYRLSSEMGPAPETCVHVAFDPEPGRVVIYEEWG